MDAVFQIILVALLGLVGGSFANAAITRIHTGKSIARGRSQCDVCEQTLRASDLIPLISWLVLRGRCRYCTEKIAVQNPLVEVATASLFVWSYLAWPAGAAFSVAALAVWLLVVVGFVILTVYDLRWFILPDVVTFPLMGLAVVQLALRVLGGSSNSPASGNLAQLLYTEALPALAAAFLGALFFYALYRYSDGQWMGGGDVKLVFLMGLLLGVPATFIAIFLAFNVAALLSLSLMVVKKLKRQDLIPFGPFLIGATFITTLYGETLYRIYLKTVGF